MAKGLIAGGLAPGDTVAVLSATRYEWTLVDFAIWFAGGVTVPIYEASSASQVEWILSDSGAGRVFVEDRGKAALLGQVLSASSVLTGRLVPVVRMDYDGEAPNLASLAAAGAGVTDAELERHRSAAELHDVESLVYTSGTTGKPKGCEIMHGNFALVAWNIVAALPELLQREDARTLMLLPLAHVLARAVQVVCLTAGGDSGQSRRRGMPGSHGSSVPPRGLRSATRRPWVPPGAGRAAGRAPCCGRSTHCSTVSCIPGCARCSVATWSTVSGASPITGRKKELLVTAAGKNVAPAPLEEKIREHQLVGHAVVVGDGKPFISALVNLDPEGLEHWCTARSVPLLSAAEACTDAAVRDAIQAAVDQANSLVSKAESIRKFRILDAAFTVESGHLTPSLKLKRAAVVKDYEAEIEELYG
ncbi:AMP-binding protein [Arthrobacter sp. UC242_113]|uniref:AMP-binding protein n=1 Tax=Arthrobacter sp. UC242_113 TaxID=3374550 RepID=UPI0037576024